MSRGMAIEAADVFKTHRFGQVQALRGASLEVPAGGALGLVGPNGAGKSTLIACLIGLLRPDSGSIAIDGRPPDDLGMRRGLGWLPERPAFPAGLSGRQCLQFHLALSGRPSRALDAETNLSRAGLERSAWDRPPARYSQGMKQRLGLAVALAGEPRLLVLDEPTTALDPLGIRDVRRLIGEARAVGCTVLMCSHQLDEVARTCDQVAFLREGTVRRVSSVVSSEALEREFLEVLS